jgi:hypothetical protein
MTGAASPSLRDLALKQLTSTDRTRADSAELAASLRRAHTNLSQLLIPLIGRTAAGALTARAVHLVQREHPWLPTQRPDQSDDAIEVVAASLAQQDLQAAREAGAAVLATLAGLLVTFIGDSLTMRLLRKSWPDGFRDAASEEGNA